MISAPWSINQPEASSPVLVPWWLHPSNLVFVFLIPMYLLVWYFGAATQGALSSAKGLFFLHGEVALLGFLALVVLGLGTLSPIRPVEFVRKVREPRATVLKLIGLLAIIGYLSWFREFIVNPGALIDAFSSGGAFAHNIRHAADKQAGLSSLAQLGIPYLIGYAFLYWKNSTAAPEGPMRALFICLVGLVAFRTFAWAERLALIEMIIALGFVWIYVTPRRFLGRSRALINLLPLLGVVFVIVLFALAEFFRSWSSYYATTGVDFFSFIGQRLTNYYFNALNTGAGRLVMEDWPSYDFRFTLQWLHKIPILGAMFSYALDARVDDFLERYGDPEFNNPGGVFTVFFDLGLPLGFVAFFLLGVFSRYVFAFVERGRSLCGLWYFIFIMVYLELFRYFYLGVSRAFLVVLGLLLIQVTGKSSLSEGESRALS